MPLDRFHQRGLVVVLAFVLGVGGCVLTSDGDDGSTSTTAGSTSTGGAGSTPPAGGPTETTAPEGPLAPADGEWVNPGSSGRPWSDAVSGLLTFRGNPTRTYYGSGPVPEAPEVRWSYPGQSGGMCGQSSVGGEAKTWCGTGWTGQPSVWVGEDGRRRVAFGAYDKAIHLLDGETGEDLLSPFDMGDIIKGSVTVDPDGFPLLYSGSRNDFVVLSMAGPDTFSELWRLTAEAVSPTKWNDDWDGSALVVDDYLFEGGENSQIHIVKLNRAEAADGTVTVDPELVFNAPGWDDQLLSDLAPSGNRANDVSIESSVAISGDTLYFTNSGGLVQGWDLSTLRDGGTPERTFRYWVGDDTDASLVIDGEGFLYVAVENERGLPRAAEVGQLVKLDPRQPDDPLVWKVDDPHGIWATPALHEDLVIAPTDAGRVVGVDRATGEVRWELDLPGPTWQSPVVVDDVLIQGDCDGVLHGFDVSDTTTAPAELWTVQLEGCIESTPAVWDGWIYVGTRGGRFYAMADPA